MLTKSLCPADSALKLQNAFLHALNDVTVEMLNQTDINELFQHIAERLLHLSGGCYAYIAIESECGKFAEIKYVAPYQIGKPSSRLLPNEGLGGIAWAENRLIYTSNYKESGNQLKVSIDIRQACAIPINCNAGHGGVLCIFYDDSDVDVKKQVSLLRKFAKIVALALDNTRSHQRKQAELSMLEAMMKINQAIYESNQYTEILESVCDLILEGFNANRARVYRCSEEGLKGLAGRILTEDKALQEALPSKIIMDESANMWSVKNRKPAHVRVNVDDDRESPRVHAHRRRYKIGCSYIVPLISDGQVWGLLSVHKPTGEEDFTYTEKRLIDLLASQLSVAINRQRLMHECEYQANHDQLTSCISRTRFEKILNNRVVQARSEQQEFSLLYVDLDGFKNINDTMGHTAGDNVLVHVSNQIKKMLDEDMCVARVGGDEFAVLSPFGFSREQVMNLGLSIAGKLSDEESSVDAMLHVNASVGISRYPQDGGNTRDLISCADIAMYHAKENGTGEVREYDAEFGAHFTRRVKLKNRIERALANDEFELHYQPRIRTSDGRVVCVEALIRWNEPEFVSVSPAEWIPLAEENGMIHSIGNWVAQRSVEFLKDLEKTNIDLKVSINISATQFDAPDFPRSVLESLEESGTPGSLVEFEITETAVIKDIELAVSKLQQIREYGITIAIDDFGVEYSSLAYLGDLPIDVLKVDRVFVQRMDSGSGRSMIEPILRLAQSLDLETVVEGVETREQKDVVMALGCSQIQGYFYSKPVPYSELPAAIEAIHALSLNNSQDVGGFEYPKVVADIN